MWVYVAGFLSFVGSTRYLRRSWRKPEELNVVYWLCASVESTLTLASLLAMTGGGPLLVPFRD